MAIGCRRLLPAWAPPGRLTSPRTAQRSQTALLAALGVDNFGSGLFLPLTLVYLTRDVGLPLNVAGPVISMGALAGLAVPAFTGRLVDRAGARSVVIASQLVQALGAAGYLLARSELPVLAAAMLLATGQQLFYSSLFALVSDVSGSGPPDRPFAVVNMVRAGCFGLGGLATGGLLTVAGPGVYRIAVAADGVSFLACAVLLAWCVRVPWPPASGSGGPDGPAGPGGRARRAGRAGPLSDRPFLALIVLTGLVMLAVDFYLTGMPVYVIEELHAPDWLPGTLLAVSTTLSSLAGTFALRMTGRLTRVAAIQAGAVLYVAWCAVSLAAILLPPAWRPADLMMAIVLLAAAGLVCGPRAGALAASVAPPQARGRYLAAFQYAFTGAGVLAPAVAALASVAVWLPWLLVATGAGVAIGGLQWLAGRLPADALIAAEAGAVSLPDGSPSGLPAPRTGEPHRAGRGRPACGHHARLGRRPASGRAHSGSVRRGRPGAGSRGDGPGGGAHDQRGDRAGVVGHRHMPAAGQVADVRAGRQLVEIPGLAWEHPVPVADRHRDRRADRLGDQDPAVQRGPQHRAEPGAAAERTDGRLRVAGAQPPGPAVRLAEDQHPPGAEADQPADRPGRVPGQPPRGAQADPAVVRRAAPPQPGRGQQGDRRHQAVAGQLHRHPAAE